MQFKLFGNEQKIGCFVFVTFNAFSARGVHSLLYFAYMCVRDLFIGGGIYLAKKKL